MAMREARVAFLPQDSAPAMGRRVLGGLADRVPGPTLDDARLLLTEVLTNAITHGSLEDGQTISVCLRVSAGDLVVEVADPGPAFTPRGRSVGAGAGSGWGLFLVDRIADDWGVAVQPSGGVVVWFRLQIDGDSAASSRAS
jgi:anti-sigma regulatory factor (Ser/Thr protein kinase)